MHLIDWVLLIAGLSALASISIICTGRAAKACQHISASVKLKLTKKAAKRLRESVLVKWHGDLFETVASARFLWWRVTENRTLFSVMQLPHTDIWIALVGGPNHDCLRNQSGCFLFAAREEATTVVVQAWKDKTGRSLTGFGQEAAYGTWWTFKKADRASGGEQQIRFYLHHPALPGAVISYISFTPQPGCADVQNGLWNTSVAASKNPTERVAIDNLLMHLRDSAVQQQNEVGANSVHQRS